MHRLFERSLKGIFFVLPVIAITFLNSCISTKKIIYFNNLPDTIAASNPIVIESVKYEDPKILTNDILAITVQTIDQSETNQPISSSSTALFNPLNGFLVDKNGNIELSLIGFIHVAGLTTSEVREVIKEKAKEYYKEPVVNVRIANFEIDILCEVVHPGTFTFPSEKVNIMEALASANDLLITGKRKNVLLIRTEGDTRKFIRWDLTSSDVFRSPYFYLRQRDILYVEPSKFKIQSSDQTFVRNIGILSTMISIVTLFLAFKNFK